MVQKHSQEMNSHCPLSMFVTVPQVLRCTGHQIGESAASLLRLVLSLIQPSVLKGGGVP